MPRTTTPSGGPESRRREQHEFGAEPRGVSRRNRRTPYTERVDALGMQGYSIVNHMLLPKAFGCSTEEDYWHLREHVQLWDVSCQRQVEIQGLDAARLL